MRVIAARSWSSFCRSASARVPTAWGLESSSGFHWSGFHQGLGFSALVSGRTIGISSARMLRIVAGTGGRPMPSRRIGWGRCDGSTPGPAGPAWQNGPAYCKRDGVRCSALSATVASTRRGAGCRGVLKLIRRWV